MSTARLVCCWLLIAASWRPLLAAEAPLIWKFRVGDEHDFQMVQNMDMKMTLDAGERQIETAVEQILDMTWKVLEVDDQGTATLMQSVSRVQMNMQAPGQPALHYDSDSDEPPTGYAAMVAPLFKAMTTEPFQMTITRRGEIVTLELPTGLAKAMQGIPGAPMMGEMFNDAGFKNMIQQSALILPESNDLNVGYEWTTKAEVENAQFGKLLNESTYGYLGAREVEGKPLEAFRYAMKIDFADEPGGVQIDIVDQESSGEILFSREAGWLEASKLRQKLNMAISAAGQTMTQQLVQTVTFERVDTKPDRE